MKKLVLSILFISLSIYGSAQCTPNTSYTKPGNYPDSLKTAWLDSVYSMTVTNVVPLDTNVLVTGIPLDVTVDSVVILSIQGIPAGYASVCNSGKCTYLGGTTGCFKISGTTSNPNLLGKHPLKVYTKTYAHMKGFGFSLPPQLDTVRSYFLEIKDGAVATGIYSLNTNDNISLYPNPTNGSFVAQAFLKEAGLVEVRVYNTLGQTIVSEKVNVSNNKLNHVVDLSNSTPGIYFFEIHTEKETYTRKIAIQ